MASADKEIIYQGDTFKVQFESLEADPIDPNSYNFTKTEYPPESAYVQVWSGGAGQYLELDGEGSDSASADVQGSIITYMLPSSFTQEAGSYKMFVTAVYSDGQEVTYMIAFKVQARGIQTGG